MLIESLKIRNFKSLRDVQLRLGGLNVFIGANGSGKSNVLDAIRVFQGIASGFTLDEIFHGRPKSSKRGVWDGVRGGVAEAAYQGAPIADLELELLPRESLQCYRYFIRFHPGTETVVAEQLKWAGNPVFSAGRDWDGQANPFHIFSSEPEPIRGDRSKPALTQLLDAHVSGEVRGAVQTFCESLENIQRLDPSVAILREYSAKRRVGRMGDQGGDFAAVVKQICEDPNLKNAYVSWLKELSPEPVQDVEIDAGARNDSSFSMIIGGRKFTAPVLSDGTLRFAAYAAAFFQPDMPELLLIEEIENGIHPTRLRVLVDLLKSQTSGPDSPQVIVTTHSPYLLAWLTEEDYRSVFWFSRSSETGETLVRPLSEVPAFPELAKRYSAADLFAEGWFENTL